MSLKAMIWVMEEAPVDNHAELVVLYALADRASDNGQAAYPAVSWIAERARCSTRTVQRHLKNLERKGLIRKGDQRIVGHFRSDRRPTVWDLDLSLTQENTGCQPDTPPNDERGDTQCRTGCQNDANGVTPSAERGDTALSPKPSLTIPKPSLNHPPIVPHGGRAPYPASFEEFWKTYPRRVGKRTAFKAWERAIKRAGEEEILVGAQALAKDPNLPQEQFIPHPTTWLNRDGWEDTQMPSADPVAKSAEDYLAEWGIEDDSQDWLEGEVIDGELL